MLCEACKGTGLKSDLALCDVCDGSGGQPQPADRDPEIVEIKETHWYDAPPKPAATATPEAPPVAPIEPVVSPLANPEVQVTPLTVTPEVPAVPPVIGANEMPTATTATPGETTVASTEGTAS